MIETIIFNLSNGIDVEQTNKRVEKYRYARLLCALINESLGPGKIFSLVGNIVSHARKVKSPAKNTSTGSRQHGMRNFSL